MSNSDDDLTFEDWDGPREIKKECTPDAPCGRLTCEACSAPQQLRWIRQTLAITKAHPGQHEIATIVVPGIPPIILSAKTIRRILPGLFERASFEGALLRGGIDVIWDSALNSWLLSAHALAIDVPPDAWGTLRLLLRLAKARYPELRLNWPRSLVKLQPLRDPEKQIPNLVKFPTHFWPRSPTGAAPAEPPPKDDPASLADWASDYTFKDFTFQIGEDTTRKPRKSRKGSPWSS
jgi:hypothetical protein